jgi:hypothetical protein
MPAENKCADAMVEWRAIRLVWTNNVEADDRGYVRIVDRASAGHRVLQLTGDAAAIAR